MKRTAIAFCLLLFLALPLHAQEYDYCAGAGGAALTCSESTQQAPTDMVADNGDTSFGKGATTDWRATRFRYDGTTGTLCKVYVRLLKTGSLAGKTADVYLYGDDGGGTPHPSGATLCATMDADTIGEDWYGFACNAAVVNGTYYWIAVNLNTAGDTSNYISWTYDTTCTYEVMDNSGDGVTWTNSSTSACQNVKLYIKE